MRRCKYGGEDAANQRTQSREAGTDNANVNFDSGPGGSTNIIPSNVCGAGDDVERVETENRGDNDTNFKHHVLVVIVGTTEGLLTRDRLQILASVYTSVFWVAEVTSKQVKAWPI